MSHAITVHHLHHQAETLIRQRTGRRPATGRTRVLAALLSRQQAMTHHDVQTCLTDELQMDRVTVYRALEWLTQNGLAHKIAGDDRIWRFRVNAEDHSHQHAHFRCTRCTRLICLDTPETVYNPDSSHSLPLLAPFPLPPGYQSHSFELTVHGLCNECV